MPTFLLLVVSDGEYPYNWDQPGGGWSSWAAGDGGQYLQGKYIHENMTLMTVEAPDDFDPAVVLDARAFLAARKMWNTGDNNPSKNPDLVLGCWRVAQTLPVDGLALRLTEIAAAEANERAAHEAKERALLTKLKAKYEPGT